MSHSRPPAHHRPQTHRRPAHTSRAVPQSSPQSPARTRAPVATATPTPPTQAHAEQPPPPSPSPLHAPLDTNGTAATTSSVIKVNATIDDVADDDDVVRPSSSAPRGAGVALVNVHRRTVGGAASPSVAAAAAAGAVSSTPHQSLSDPTAASSSFSMRHHHHHPHKTSKLAAGGSLFGTKTVPAQSPATAAASDSSPAHRKRSKSESRRRRERKQIAAGELEVRQANETLMRYLRQCTEINDASLSGELEIDQTYDDRRVHRKTRSQRERRGFVASMGIVGGGGGAAAPASSGSGGPVIGPTASAAAAALVAAGGAGAAGTGGVAAARGRLQLQNGLTNILNSLAEDIRPATGNGTGPPDFGIGSNGHAQTGEIYNPFTPIVSPSEGAAHISQLFGQHSSEQSRSSDQRFRRGCFRDCDRSFRHDEHLHNSDDVENGTEHSDSVFQHNNAGTAWMVQHNWMHMSNVCHGLLGGLALAHLLLVLTTNPFDWFGVAAVAEGARRDACGALSHAYASSFFALAVLCLVSVLDRMDFCRLNSSVSDAISFRWIIILMIYLATNIISLTAESTIESEEFSVNNSTDWMEKMENNRVLNVWNSLSIGRSVCALAGWLMVALFPQDDLLSNHLADMEEHLLR